MAKDILSQKDHLYALEKSSNLNGDLNKAHRAQGSRAPSRRFPSGSRPGQRGRRYTRACWSCWLEELVRRVSRGVRRGVRAGRGARATSDTRVSGAFSPSPCSRRQTTVRLFVSSSAIGQGLGAQRKLTNRRKAEWDHSPAAKWHGNGLPQARNRRERGANFKTVSTTVA